jgi:predicted translin family RNA/ssDNA-binding protein
VVNIDLDKDLYAEVGRLTAEKEQMEDKIIDLEIEVVKACCYAAEQKRRADKAEENNEALKEIIHKMWEGKLN